MRYSIKAYPGCPPASWMIAKRVTNPYEDADAFISFTGRKGSSKSTTSSAFCEGVANDIAYLRGKAEDPEKFFNIDHVRSITEEGALELLSSGALKRENSVFLLDDTGTQWGARNFQSPVNKLLNSILQICRVYKCVLVANFIMKNHVDLQARQMTDFRAQMLWKNTYTKQAFYKFYYVEQGDNGKEYTKFLRWHGKRISRFVSGLPSPEFEAAYKKMRRENTDGYIDDAQEKLKAGFQKMTGEHKERKSKYPSGDEIQDAVLAIQRDPELTKKEKSQSAIAKKLGTTREKVMMVME